MNDFRVLLQAVLDKSGINTELKEVQDIINKYSVEIMPELKTASLRNQMKTISKDIANDFNKTFGTNLTGNDVFKAYENQAKQVIEHNKLVDKSFTELRKNTYQSIGTKSPELQKMAEMYKQDAIEAEKAVIEQNKLVESMERVRAGSEKAAKAEEKRSQLTQNKAINKALEDEYIAVSKIHQAINSGTNESKVEKLTASFRGLGFSTEDTQKKLSGVNGALNSLNASSDNKSLINNAKILESEYKKVENQIRQLTATQKGFATESQRMSSAGSMKLWLDNNSKASKLFKADIDQMIGSLRGADDLTVPELNKINAEFEKIKLNAREMGLLGKTVGDSFKDMGSKFFSWITVSGGIMTAVTGLRKMKDAVIEIDTAMTNLYKVTDETNSKYNDFLEKANANAQKLGRSVSSLITQSAEWAKLGFSIDESAELAQVSSIYANVGEVDDKTAVSDMVTAMKAFNVQASDSILIIDKLNALGNQYAVSSADLGEGLRNSASALALAGNDIDQSLAMITAMSEVTQNASESGNALKILSMRLRGMKGELEALGEESDGIESISKIQTQLLNLSNNKVNIFDDHGNFKSTYEIMKDIANVWESMSQVDQADMLEIIAGKQRGNSIAALLTNMSQAQNALDSSVESSGSAYAEQEKWMQSIEAKAGQFEAAFQSLSNTVIDSDLIKFFVDLGTTVTNSIDGIIKALGSLGTISAIGGGILGSKGLGQRNCCRYNRLRGSRKSLLLWLKAVGKIGTSLSELT